MKTTLSIWASIVILKKLFIGNRKLGYDAINLS